MHAGRKWNKVFNEIFGSACHVSFSLEEGAGGRGAGKGFVVLGLA